jgi:hypothetical protein
MVVRLIKMYACMICLANFALVNVYVMRFQLRMN